MKSRHNRAIIAPNLTASDEMNDNILVLFNTYKDGLNLSQIISHTKIPRRTLQRRIQSLIQEGKLRRLGKGPATRYNIVTAVTVKKTKFHRQGPVSYSPDFLEYYIPQKTFFLEPEVQEKLWKSANRLGDTAKNETFALQIYEQLLIDLSWSSSKLEGNSYSLLETEYLLRNQQQASGKDQIETQMILNHKEAVSFLIRNKTKLEFTSATIRSIHALLSDSLLSNQDDRGKIRTTPVGIEGSVYIPLNVPVLLQEQFDLFIHKIAAIKDPFEQSFFAMVFIPYIQPFVDINKRTSRITCNIPFIKNNITPLSFNTTDRDEYIKAMIAVYEKNDIEPLKELFIDAYSSSALRYQAARSALVPPHPLKIKYRDFIKNGVAQLIKTQKNNPRELNYDLVDKEDREELINLLAKEIQGLHEGNFVVYHVLPSEFEKWARKFRKE